MSNRSAKLLLEVAEAIEYYSKRNGHSKLAGERALALNAMLVDEITTWARGYKEHINRRKSPTFVEHKPKPVTVVSKITADYTKRCIESGTGLFLPDEDKRDAVLKECNEILARPTADILHDRIPIHKS